MTYSPFPITDKEAAQFGPLPKDGHYRHVRLPSGKQAILTRVKGQCSLTVEKELEGPYRVPLKGTR